MKTKDDRRVISMYMYERIGKPFNEDGVRSLGMKATFNLPGVGQIEIDHVLSNESLDRLEAEAMTILEARLSGGLK